MSDLIPIHVNWQRRHSGEEDLEAMVGNYRATVTKRMVQKRHRDEENWFWDVDLIWPDTHISKLASVDLKRPPRNLEEAKSAAIHALCLALMGPAQYIDSVRM